MHSEKPVSALLPVERAIFWTFLIQFDLPESPCYIKFWEVSGCCRFSCSFYPVLVSGSDHHDTISTKKILTQVILFQQTHWFCSLFCLELFDDFVIFTSTGATNSNMLKTSMAWGPANEKSSGKQRLGFQFQSNGSRVQLKSLTWNTANCRWHFSPVSVREVALKSPLWVRIYALTFTPATMSCSSF